MDAYGVGDGGTGRRAAAALLAVVVAFTAAAVSRCDAGGASSPAPRAQERGATNPPAGVPPVFTGQRLDWAVCPAPSGAQGDGEAPGEDYECATMKAPLDYARPGGGTIDVALIRKRATGPEDGRIGSLLLNFGGPGVSGVVTLPRRGGRLRRPGRGLRPGELRPPWRRRHGPRAVRAGHLRGRVGLRQARSGRLLPYVGTSYTARDMELMRFLLGDERLHYFGVSYGTRLGGVYAHLFPRNVGRLVLEAPVDPVLDRFRAEIAGARAVQLAFDRFARHCAKTYDDCPTGSGPEQARQRVNALLDRLKEKPAPAEGGEDLDDSLAAHGIANHLDRGRDGWEPLVKALREVMERAGATRCWRRRTTTARTARPAAPAPARASRATTAPPRSSPSAAPTPICARTSRSTTSWSGRSPRPPRLRRDLGQCPLPLLRLAVRRGERRRRRPRGGRSPGAGRRQHRRPDDAVRGRPADGGRTGRGGRGAADGAGRGARVLPAQPLRGAGRPPVSRARHDTGGRRGLPVTA